MEYRVLGRTGLRVSALGFGCGDVGGLMVRGTAADQERAVARALALGINYFDTAPIYGLGHSEEVVGRALEGLRERPYVFTKASLLDGGDNSVRHNLKRDSLLRDGVPALPAAGSPAGPTTATSRGPQSMNRIDGASAHNFANTGSALGPCSASRACSFIRSNATSRGRRRSNCSMSPALVAPLTTT